MWIISLESASILVCNNQLIGKENSSYIPCCFCHYVSLLHGFLGIYNLATAIKQARLLIALCLETYQHTLRLQFVLGLSIRLKWFINDLISDKISYWIMSRNALFQTNKFFAKSGRWGCNLRLGYFMQHSQLILRHCEIIVHETCHLPPNFLFAFQ